MAAVHGGALGATGTGEPDGTPAGRPSGDARPLAGPPVTAPGPRRARRAARSLAVALCVGAAQAGLAVPGAGCGGDAATGPAGRADDAVYAHGLDRVLAHGRDAHERDALRRAYDAGWGAGAEEAAEVDARTDVEARRLGCREVYPVLARAIARDGIEPPPRDALCRPRARASVLEARRRGARFDATRDAVVAEAQRLADRRLGYLLVEAHEYGYERGFRRWRGAWDEARAASLERAGCREAVDRAIREGALSELHEPPMTARCEAIGASDAVASPATR